MRWLRSLAHLIVDYLRWCAGGGLERKCLELQTEEPRADLGKILAGVQEAMLFYHICGVSS